MFYDILERKNAFPSDKNKKFKKWKKPVSPWFWSKIGHFIRCFYFGQYRPGKCVLGYSKTKKRFSGLKIQEVEKVDK